MSYLKKKIVGVGAVLAFTAGVATFLQIGNKAQAQNDTDPGKAARCATRLAITFLGTSPTAALMSSADPQSQVDALIGDAAFQERFARFFNSRTNDAPGATIDEDAAYHMAKYILANNKPWKDAFIGQYNVVGAGTGAARTATVQPDPNGLGYFRSKAWMDRYAGNELTGLKLVTAYRLQNNTLGLTLKATTNAPGADVSATGRAAAACKGCHYDGWYALDKAALVLNKVQRQGNTVSYVPNVDPTTAKPVLGDQTAVDDAEFVKKMVDSDAFLFNACRNAFNFLYGRDENACEAAVFDKCVESIRASGMMQSALATVAKDPSFCQ